MKWLRLRSACSEQWRDLKSFAADRYDELAIDGSDVVSLFRTYYRQNVWFQGTLQGYLILGFVAGMDWWLGHPLAARMAYMAPMFHATQRGGKLAGSLVIAASLLALTLSNYHIPEAHRHSLILEGIVSLTVMIAGMMLVDLSRQRMNRVKHAATHDALTGAANRAGFDAAAEAILSEAVQESTAVTIVLVDCDNFKALNDQHGHQSGDAVLINLVKVLKKAVGREGCVGRTGGDEFVLVIPRRRRATIEKVMMEVRERFETVIADLGTPTSFSFGISEYRTDGLSMTSLIQVADRDMYRDKARIDKPGYALADVS